MSPAATEAGAAAAQKQHNCIVAKQFTTGGTFQALACQTSATGATGPGRKYLNEQPHGGKTVGLDPVPASSL